MILRCNFCRNMLNRIALQLIKSELPNGGTSYTSKVITINDNTELPNLFCSNGCIVRHMKYQKMTGNRVADLTNLKHNIMFTEFGVTIGYNSSMRCLVIGRNRVKDRMKVKLVTGCVSEWVLSSHPAKYIEDNHLCVSGLDRMSPRLPQHCGVNQ